MKQIFEVFPEQNIEIIELKKKEVSLDLLVPNKELSIATSEYDKMLADLNKLKTEICEKCGRTMVYKMGRFGKFLACPGFPECKNTKKIVTETEGECPKCGKKMLLKKSKKGRSFYGCEGYPECDFVSWEMPVEEKCPKCGGYMVFKRGRKGENYHVCVNENCRERVAVQADEGEEE